MYKILFSLLFLISVGACSNDQRPGKSEATSQIETYINYPAWSKYIKCTDVKYENGYSNDPNKYTVEASYTVNFTKSSDAIDLFSSIGISLLYGTNAKAGDERRVSEQFNFLKTEKGWILQGRIR